MSVVEQPVRSPSRSREKVRIFQNVYADYQAGLTDPAFVASDGRRNANTHYREVGLFARLYHAGKHREAEYTGIVSPKFGEKTRRTGSEFVDFIVRNPGYDVYFINPFPQHSYYCFNVWSHAELCHPGLTRLAQTLFSRAGIDFDVGTMGRNDARSALYSNFWAGNERFWDRFMDLNLSLLSALEAMNEADRARYFGIDPYYPDPVPVTVFIFERLFSTLLKMDPTIRALAWPYRREDVLALASDSVDQLRIAASFMDVVDEIDRRGTYDGRDRAIFDALSGLIAHDTLPRKSAYLR